MSNEETDTNAHPHPLLRPVDADLSSAIRAMFGGLAEPDDSTPPEEATLRPPLTPREIDERFPWVHAVLNHGADDLDDAAPSSPPVVSAPAVPDVILGPPLVGVDPYKHMTVKHHFVGGVYCKEMHIPPTHWRAGHRHSFDHLSVLASGRAIVEVDGERTEHVAPAVLTIAGKKVHTIIPLEPCVWLCIHATSCMDPEKIDEEVIDRASMPQEV